MTDPSILTARDMLRTQALRHPIGALLTCIALTEGVRVAPRQAEGHFAALDAMVDAVGVKAFGWRF